MIVTQKSEEVNKSIIRKVTRVNLDSIIGIINNIPQGIARVILNLITHAFYAGNKRLLQFESSNQVSRLIIRKEYKLTVFVKT